MTTRQAADQHVDVVDGPLRGGTAHAGRVLKVGDTVRRPAGPHTPAVHALLRHLNRSGFPGVPTALSIDGTMEVLSFIPGGAAYDPMPDWALTDDALAGVAGLIRDYHAHCAGFDTTNRQWSRPIPPRWRGSLVTHNDVHPANVIFRDHRAVALIDFDLAAPGCAAWELAVTACFWVPMLDPSDIADARRERVTKRLRLLLDTYGADAQLRQDAVSALLDANTWISSIIEEGAASGHPAFGRIWSRRAGMHRRARDWLLASREELARTIG